MILNNGVLGMYPTSLYPHRDFLDNPGDLLFYTDSFRRVLEDHRIYLRETGNVNKVVIAPGLAYRFEFNFYGLMKYKNVPPHLWWLLMRMMEMTSPDQMTREMSYYLYPDESVLTQIRSFHASQTS
jgi:hypothetical protein